MLRCSIMNRLNNRLESSPFQSYSRWLRSRFLLGSTRVHRPHFKAPAIFQPSCHLSAYLPAYNRLYSKTPCLTLQHHQSPPRPPLPLPQPPCLPSTALLGGTSTSTTLNIQTL